MKKRIVKDIKINPLESIQHFKLSYDEIVEEVIELIKKHPRWSNEWNDFLSSNAGRMIIEIFSFIADKLIKRLDFTANELFLPTAVDPQSILNILKIIGYQLTPPRGSQVEVTATIVAPTMEKDDEIIISSPALNDILTLKGIDLNGDIIYFEVLADENDYETPVVLIRNDHPDYENLIKDINAKYIAVDPTTSTADLIAYNGSTIVEELKITTPSPAFTLSRYPTIYNSIKVMLKISENIYQELRRVDNFIKVPEDPEYIYPYYTLEVDNLYRYTIKFGTREFGGIFEDVIPNFEETYKDLKIYYRIGGGSNTNIVSNSIDEYKTFINTKGNKNFRIRFINFSPAVGGSDGEKIENAKFLAPFFIKSLDRTTTAQDYIALLKKQQLVPLWNVLIETPDEKPDKVPFLFCYIYVSPQRNFDAMKLEKEIKDNPLFEKEINFSIPDPEQYNNDDLYLKIFNYRLNHFLNLRGFYKFQKERIEINPNKSIYIEAASNKTIKYPKMEEYKEEAKILYDYLIDKKIVGIENVFKFVQFTPLKLNAKLYYKIGFDKLKVYNAVVEKIYDFFSIEKNGFGQPIILSKIYSSIHDIDGVAYFQITNLSKITSLEDINKKIVGNIYPNDTEICFLLPLQILEKLPSEYKYIYSPAIELLRE